MGILAFWLIMAVVSYLGIWWLNGKLGKWTAANDRVADKNLGKVHIIRFRGRHIAFRTGRDFWVRLAFMALGPSAVMGLSVAYAQILPLHIVFGIYVLPAYLAMIVLGILFPKWGKRALAGGVAGILATIFYDVVRLALTYAIGLPDPIPHIGTLLLGQQLTFSSNYGWVGYLWRMFGNGAGLGVLYAMLPDWFFSIKGGLIYGEFVGMGMFAVLFFFPVAQLHLFVLNPIVAINGVLGHWAYGIVLGYLFARTKLKAFFPRHGVKLKKPLTWRK